jgi:hypothetical protein
MVLDRIGLCLCDAALGREHEPLEKLRHGQVVLVTDLPEPPQGAQ